MENGDVAAPATVPAAGTAAYAGFACGRAAPNVGDEPMPLVADAGIIFEFSTRQIAVAVASTVTDDAALAWRREGGIVPFTTPPEAAGRMIVKASRWRIQGR